MAYQIDMHERRLEQYMHAYQRYMDKLAHLLFLYSAVAIFLLPIAKQLMLGECRMHGLYYTCFFLLLMMLGISVFYAARLMLPAKSLLPVPLSRYYGLIDVMTLVGMDECQIDKELTDRYVSDLKALVRVWCDLITRKENYYRRMCLWGVLVIIPYVVCLIFHMIYEMDG